MHDISSILFSGVIESRDVLITGVRGTARRWSFFAGNGLTGMGKKIAMPVSPSSAPRYALPSRLRGEQSEGGGAKQSNRFANFLFFDVIGRMQKRFHLHRTDSPAGTREVEITYFGRTGVSLKMTSERMVIPAGSYTVGKLLCSLYKRGDRWVDELDDSQLMCTVNGREAGLFDTIAPGAEICFSSTRASLRQ